MSSLPARPVRSGSEQYWRISPMTEADLDEVLAVETAAYAFPWSRSAFEDALKSGYSGICLRDSSGALIGYCVLMPVVDEMHLLNLCVAPNAQGQGAGSMLCDQALQIARQLRLAGMLLEVRSSNLHAIRLYKRRGFTVIGRRKNYYPAREHTREDAIVMRLTFAAEDLYAAHRANF